MPADRVSQFGILRIDESGRVVEFVEKPRGDSRSLRSLEAPPALLERFSMPAWEKLTASRNLAKGSMRRTMPSCWTSSRRYRAT